MPDEQPQTEPPKPADDWWSIAAPLAAVAAVGNAFLTVESIRTLALSGAAAAQDVMYVVVLFPGTLITLGLALHALSVFKRSRPEEPSRLSRYQTFRGLAYLNVGWSLIQFPLFMWNL